ncbi:MAG: hypothetical protein HY716_08665 [Planctomycetes bacterium]|nr:hypothetical protein [Planctomycetota bacterium]
MDELEKMAQGNRRFGARLRIVSGIGLILFGLALSVGCGAMLIDTVTHTGFQAGSSIAFFGLGALLGLASLIGGVRLLRGRL